MTFSSILHVMQQHLTDVHVPGQQAVRHDLQGHLFRAAFLQHVPLFIRNLSENVVLCLAAAAVESTAKTVLAHMELSWRRLVTSRLHSPYFENMVSNPPNLTCFVLVAAHALAFPSAQCMRTAESMMQMSE